jgi:tryptophanyl-tRNA synthetase
MAQKQRIVSGIQPSGKLHVGNYLGAVKNFVDLQNSGKYDCFFFIADLHSLSETYDPKQKKEDTYNLLASLLALGIDPKKSTLFLQSQIAGHTELAWLFSTIMPIAELERMTQYKDKASMQKSNINAALLTYPVLQAADVLIYKGELVPVGKDQEQHIELIRIIAKKMNAKFGTKFPESKSLFTKAPKIMSLRESDKKMSKSLGDAHVLNIFDDPQITKTKIQKAVTGISIHSPEAKGFVELYKQFVGEDPQGQFSVLKPKLSEVIISHFAASREIYIKLVSQPEKLNTILDEGRKKAQPIATQTLNETKQKMGLL